MVRVSGCGWIHSGVSWLGLVVGWRFVWTSGICTHSAVFMVLLSFFGLCSLTLAAFITGMCGEHDSAASVCVCVRFRVLSLADAARSVLAEAS